LANRQQQKRKGDNFGDEDPTERVFMDSLRLRLLALVKSVGQKRCDGSNTTKTSAGSACIFFPAGSLYLKNLSRRPLPASTALPPLTVSNLSFGQDHAKSVNKRTRFETDAHWLDAPARREANRIESYRIVSKQKRSEARKT